MILVTGATGTVGGAVLTALHARGHKLRALTRRPREAVFPEGVEVVGGDMGRPETLGAALDGVEKVFLMSLGADKATHDANVVAAAVAAGVRHVVQLSTLGVEEADNEEENPLGYWHRLAEQALVASGLDWTILRPNGFMTHVLGWAASVRTEGVVRGPVADLAEAVVDPADVAEAAAHCLTTPGHVGRVYALTGPEALTLPQQTDVLGSVIGRPLRFETVPLDVQREMLARHFSPQTVEGVIRSLRRAIESGDEFRGRVSPDLRHLLGREPRGLRQWAEAHADAFRADV